MHGNVLDDSDMVAHGDVEEPGTIDPMTDRGIHAEITEIIDAEVTRWVGSLEDVDWRRAASALGLQLDVTPLPTTKKPGNLRVKDVMLLSWIGGVAVPGCQYSSPPVRALSDRLRARIQAAAATTANYAHADRYAQVAADADQTTPHGRLLYHRSRQRIPQRDMAKVADVTIVTWRRVEKGQSYLKLSAWTVVAEYLGIDRALIMPDTLDVEYPFDPRG